MKRIIIAFPKEQNNKGIISILKRTGYTDIQVCNSRNEVLSSANGSEEGIIICGYKLKDTLSSTLINRIPKSYSMLMLIANPSLCETIDSRISVLTLPINKGNFLATVNMLLNKNKTKKLLSVEEQEIIEEAKKLMMQEKKISEQQAHRYLQVTSMNNGHKMIDTARKILEGDDNCEKIRNCN